MGFLSGTVAKGLPANTGDTGAVGLIPASGRLPGGGNVFLLVFLYSQYSCWENPVNRGACWATIHGVSKSLTWLSDCAYTHILRNIIKAIEWGYADYKVNLLFRCSVPQSYLTLCDPLNCSAPGFPVLHHLPELTQTHVHWVNDAIQPSHSLSSPSPPAFSLSQHQGLF